MLATKVFHRESTLFFKGALKDNLRDSGDAFKACIDHPAARAKGRSECGPI